MLRACGFLEAKSSKQLYRPIGRVRMQNEGKGRFGGFLLQSSNDRRADAETLSLREYLDLHELDVIFAAHDFDHSYVLSNKLDDLGAVEIGAEPVFLGLVYPWMMPRHDLVHGQPPELSEKFQIVGLGLAIADSVL